MTKCTLSDYNLIAGIHTIEISHKNILTEKQKGYPFVDRSFDRYNYLTGESYAVTIINPNSYLDDNIDILCYSEYMAVISEIMEALEVESFRYRRVDLMLNSFEDNFNQFFKLNNLLLYLFTMTHKYKNDEPIIYTPQTFGKSGVGIQSKSGIMGAHYYDKPKESDNRSLAKARLEFQIMKLAGKTPLYAVDFLLQRLERLSSFYKDMQEKANEKMCTAYDNFLQENGFSTSNRKDMITDFVKEKRNTFFTHKQLANFCSMLGVETFYSRAKNLKGSCYNTDFFKESLVEMYIDKIKKAIADFVSS